MLLKWGPMANGASVFLIEDDVSVRDIVEDLLVLLGYAVVACGNAEEAIARLNAGKDCDVVITDVAMPGTSGLEVATLIRRWRPRTPVILISGDPGAIESAIEDGYVPLLKPFTADQLQSVMNEAMRGKSPNRHPR